VVSARFVVYTRNMARSFIDDPLLSFNFALIDVPVAGAIPLAFPYKLVRSAISNGSFIGMKSVTIPTFSNETREIKEGNWPHTHQVLAGHSSGGDCVLTQAVLPFATDMYLWFTQGIWGRIAPRRHLIVAHLRHSKRMPARIILLQDCLPVAWTPSSALDATSSEVCVEELTIRVQRAEIIPFPSDETISF